MTAQQNNWYAYTFDKSITSVNVIFSKNGSPQSVDIMGVSQSTCYETDNPAGKFTVRETTCGTTGMENKLIAQTISIYPQPVKSEFYLNLPNTGYTGNYILNIINLQGKMIQETHFTGQTAHIQLLTESSGVYLIKIRNVNGSEIYTSKIVKM